MVTLWRRPLCPLLPRLRSRLPLRPHAGPPHTPHLSIEASKGSGRAPVSECSPNLHIYHQLWLGYFLINFWANSSIAAESNNVSTPTIYARHHIEDPPPMVSLYPDNKPGT